MRRLPALISLLVATGLFVLASAESQPEWLRTLGLDWWGLADARDAQLVEQRRAVQLEGSFALVQYRQGMRRQIVGELLAGRLDLLTAAARFRELNRLSPSVEKVLVRVYAGMSSDERACRHLLEWMKEDNIRTPTWPACRAVIERLQADLDYYLCVHGEVKLPNDWR